MCYFSGRGVPKDHVQAVRWLRKAADQSHREAQYELALRFANGEGTIADMTEAARLLGLAANQGHSMAQTELGTLYRHGEGVPKDDMKAVNLYLQASWQGNPHAQLQLSSMYEHGVGVNKNLAEAYAWATVAGVYAPHYKAHPSTDDLVKNLSPAQRSLALQRSREIYQEIESKLGKK
jgi:TPR repeat protein